MKIITTTIAIVALSLSTSALAAGGLTKAAVRNLVKPTEGTVKSCSASAGVYGTLKVRFKVNPDGSVSDFTSLAPHKDDAAAKCASDAITGIKFPESSHGRQSKYRFQLGGPKGAVGQVLKDNASTLSACGKDKGNVSASFKVGTDGTPSDVKVKGKKTPPDVASCVTDAISKMHFPNQPKQTTFTESVKVGG